MVVLSDDRMDENTLNAWSQVNISNNSGVLRFLARLDGQDLAIDQNQLIGRGVILYQITQIDILPLSDFIH